MATESTNKPKVVKRPQARVPRPPDAAQPGDVIEFALTIEYTQRRGNKIWLKSGLASAVQMDETSDQAKDRISSFVLGQLNEALEAFKREDR